MVYLIPDTEAVLDWYRMQAAFYSAITTHFLRDAGIRPGMSVLDVGSGNGDLSVLLADFVGPKGHVLGIDISADAVAKSRSRILSAGIKNVNFVEEDASLAAFPASFDAVVGRFVLMYARNAAATVANLRGCARPGGTVIFIEPDYSGARSSVPLPLCSEVQGLIQRTLEFSGADTTIGLKLHRVFVEAGLPRPRMQLAAAIGGGPDFEGYELAAGFLSILMPLAEKGGLARATDLGLETLPQRMRAEVMESGGVVVFPSLVAASSRLSDSNQDDGTGDSPAVG